MSIPISIWTKTIKRTENPKRQVKVWVWEWITGRKGEMAFGGKEREGKSDPVGRKGRRERGVGGKGEERGERVWVW